MGILQAWAQTLGAALRDKGVMLMLIIAPMLYALYYPWPYATEVVTRVPVLIVDLDHTGLSRQIIRLASASPRLKVLGTVQEEQIAQQALWRGEIEGYAVLPAELKRQVVRGQSAVVRIEANGAYALLNKAVLYGLSEAVGTASAGIEIKKRQVSGQSTLQALASRSPLNLVPEPLFNPTEGYGSFVVPAVAVLIIQQTLLIGVALFVGSLVEANQHVASVRVWTGRMLALVSFGGLSGLAFFGWVFVAQGYPRGANPWGALVLLMLWLPAVCNIGALLGLWFADRERALQVLMFTSLPMVFLAGFSWPAQALPEALQTLRWLLPSTAAIQAALRLNQMGAVLWDVREELMILLGLSLASAAWLAAVLMRQSRNMR